MSSQGHTSCRRDGPQLLGQVVSNERVGAMFRLTLEVPGWRGSRPGQFALLHAEPSRCFLARALSVSDEAGERLVFLIAPVGDGTRELSGTGQGAPVWVLGPLGNGFDVDALVTSPGRAVIVAGGVGMAPFPLLLARMGVRYGELFSRPPALLPEGMKPAGDPPQTDGPEVLVLLGCRDSSQFEGSATLREAAARLGESGLRCRLEVATEDGSHGPAEKVTDLAERHLRPGDRVAVCGPPAMATAVWRICKAVPDVQTWFSLEANMACGVGSCHGCVTTLANGSQARVCHDGPVFRGEEVFGG